MSDVAVVAADYARLRHGAAALWLSRDVVAVHGPDALGYLQGQCSQDVASLAVGAGVPALLLSPQGKLDAFVRVTRTGDDVFVVDVDGGFGEVVVARLTRFRLRVKVDIEPLSWRCLALRGPQIAAGGAGGGAEVVAPAGGVVVPAGWGAVRGVDLLGEQPVLPDGVALCDPAAWEAVRIEAGVPLMGAELDGRTIAAEAGLVQAAVSFDKGCYTGQELVARLDARGSRVARRLRGVVAAASPGRSGPAVTAGAAVEVDGRSVGTVTSSAWSPGLEATVCLAYLHRSVELPCPVRVVDEADGTAVVGEARELPLV